MRTIILYILCAQIIVGSLLYGAVDAYVWGSLCIFSLVALLIFLFDRTQKKRKFATPYSLFAIAILFLFSLSIQFFLPATELSIPSFQMEKETYIYYFSSIEIKKSFYIWLMTIISFILIPNVLKSRSDLKKLLGCMIFVPSVQGVLGIFQYFSPQGSFIRFYFSDSRSFNGITGTYVERNIYACMLAMGASIILAQLVYFIVRVKTIRYRRELFDIINYYILQNLKSLWILILALCLVCVHISVFFSYSRAGILGCFVSTFLFFVFYRSFVKEKNKEYITFILVILLLFSFLVFAIVAYNLKLSERFSHVFNDLQYRWQLFKLTWNIFCDHYLWGCGGGNFTYAMEIYRKPPLNTNYLYAHNDYLQFLAEYGIISTILGIMFLLLWLKIVFGKVESAAKFHPTLWCGCMVAVIVSFCFALFHFPFQIPGHRLFVAYLMAILLAMKTESSKPKRHTKKSFMENNLGIPS